MIGIGIAIGLSVAVLGGGGAAGPSPGDVSGLDLWIDPSTATGRVLDGSNVVSLLDRAGGRELTASGTVPLQNGGLYSDGTSGMVFTNAYEFPEQFTLIYRRVGYGVNAPSNSREQYGRLFSRNDGGGHVSVYVTGAHAYWEVDAGAAETYAYGAVGAAAVGDSLPSFDGAHISSIAYTSNNSIAFRSDGTDYPVQGYSSGGGVPPLSKYLFYPGADESEYSEILVYNRVLSAGEIQALETYLTEKWA